MKSKILIIDGDLFVYKSGFAHRKKELGFKLINKTDDNVVIDFGPCTPSEAKSKLSDYQGDEWELQDYYKPEPLNHVLGNLKLTLNSLFKETGVADYELYITSNDRSNYRFEYSTIAPYKGSRSRCRICYNKVATRYDNKEIVYVCPGCDVISKNDLKSERPYYYEDIREYLISNWGAAVISGEEADDRIGIRYSQLLRDNKDPLMVHIDKDINNVPGNHYNPDSKEHYFITEEGALFNFYKQMLTGDSVDNIPGIPGCGPKTADALLKDCRNEQDYENRIIDIFMGNHFDVPRFKKLHTMKLTYDEAYYRLKEVGILLYIRREEGELWSPCILSP